MKKKESTHVYKLSREGYTYGGLIKKLFEEDIINETEKKLLVDFGGIRNRILHRVVKYYFQTYDWFIIKKEENNIIKSYFLKN